MRQVMVDLADTGAEFLVAAELDHELADGGVLGVRGEVAGINAPVEMRNVGVLEFDAVRIDHQSGRCGAGVLAVGNDIGDQFPEDDRSQADAGGAFHVERVVEMLVDKAHEQVEGINQVTADGKAVVVAFGVAATQQGIEFVAGHNALDRGVVAEHQGGGQGVAGLAGGVVLAYETGDLQQILGREVGPGVLG